MRFYLKLAVDAIRKNRKLYLPYLLASALMVCMYYIMTTLAGSEFVVQMRGGADLKFVLELGKWVILLFAVLFLFYTNAFLIRSREKEFGLYSVLGMNRGGIRKLYFIETLLCFAGSLLAGALSGTLLSKLAELLLRLFVGAEADYEILLSPRAMGQTALCFAVIYLLLYLYCSIRITKASTAGLLKSENFGEKPPKGNLILGLLGLAILIWAYYLAVTIGHPVEAITVFFVAVLMVIVATYILFISGSVLMCRLLQKRKSFYYKPENFVTVSTMAFRMKRNGAGLASICILLTMVLVMLSSSSCLYLGREQALANRCPLDIGFSLQREGCSEDDPAFVTKVFEAVEKSDAENAIVEGSRIQFAEYSISGFLEENGISFNTVVDADMTISMIDKLTYVHLLSLEDYNRMGGEGKSLPNGEILLVDPKHLISGDELKLGDVFLKIVGRSDTVYAQGQAAVLSITSDLYVIAEDPISLARKLVDSVGENGSVLLYLKCIDQFDTEIKGIEGQQAIIQRIRKDVKELLEQTGTKENAVIYFNCYEVDKADFFSTFGGLFFIGIILSVVFLVATALIIYYKQVSEGYEDQARFAILQKVGMTEEDIRRNIRSQMRLVFFLPIVMAVVHLGFAFPLIFKSLLLFGVKDLGLLIATSLGSAVLCGGFYWLCYKLTGEAYYRIVK